MPTIRHRLKIILLAGSALLLTSPSAYAATLAENLQTLLETHKRALAADADVSAAKERVAVAKGEWNPTFDLTTNIGHEERNKPTGSTDTNFVPRNLDLSITQKLWDFGSTNSSIRSAEITLTQAQSTRSAAIQTLLLEGITAHLNVIRAQKLLDFAKGSTANIRKQTELEDARVQRGAGFSTDVLQAKTQLAGALAREIQSQGNLKVSLNRYRAVYGTFPEKIAILKSPRLPVDLLPKSLDETVELALEGNPQLEAARLSADIAREDIRKTRADGFAPVFEGSVENNFKEDNGGTLGSQQERLIKLEATYSFNLGATAINTLKASKQTYIATTNRYGDTKDQIEEQARNAWDNLEIARINAEHLHNQANIAAEFLELARRERQLGNRSLIDVLAGETSLINASSDAAAADTNVAIAVYTLLNVLGSLAPDVVN